MWLGNSWHIAPWFPIFGWEMAIPIAPQLPPSHSLQEFDEKVPVEQGNAILFIPTGFPGTNFL